MTSPSAQIANAAAPVFLCADPDEAKRLSLRDLHAVCPDHDAATGMLQQYRGRTVYVTPRARRERFGVAAVLNVLGCAVHALEPEFTVEADNPAGFPAEPMFPNVPDPEAATSEDGVTVGGALTLALAMPDLEFVSSPIFTKGQLGTITGHPASGKTTLMTGLCAAQALDLPFGPLTPESEGLVYIVSAEDFQGTRNRILAEATRLRLNTQQRTRLDDRLRWVHVDTNVSAATIRVAIEADAAGRDVALIFVDTGPALFCGENENDNVALRNFVEGFANWKDLPGTPVTVLAWHPSKGAGADRLEPRGASAIKGTCDFNLTIWRDDDRVALAYTKVRAQHFDPIEGKLSLIELVAASGKRYFAPVVRLDAADQRPDRSDASGARQAILKALSVTRAKPPTVRELARVAGVSVGAASRHLQHLADAKPALATKDPVDDHYTLTSKGRERAQALAEQSRDSY